MRRAPSIRLSCALYLSKNFLYAQGLPLSKQKLHICSRFASISLLILFVKQFLQVLVMIWQMYRVLQRWVSKLRFDIWISLQSSIFDQAGEITASPRIGYWKIGIGQSQRGNKAHTCFCIEYNCDIIVLAGVVRQL